MTSLLSIPPSSPPTDICQEIVPYIHPHRFCNRWHLHKPKFGRVMDVFPLAAVSVFMNFTAHEFYC